jgi:hypothetical protein
MFNFVKYLIAYKTTNLQTFINNTTYDAEITITTNSSTYTQFNCICPPLNKALIPVNRQDFGNVVAHVIIKYSNNSTIEYDFDIRNFDCEDKCELYDTYVMFNDAKIGTYNISVVEPVNEPTNEPVNEPVNKQVVEPLVEPTVEPTKEPVNEPVNESTKEPVNEPVNEPVVEPVNEPVNESTKEPVNEPVNEPVVEPVNEPVNEPVVKPLTNGSTNKKKCNKCGNTNHSTKKCHKKH